MKASAAATIAAIAILGGGCSTDVPETAIVSVGHRSFVVEVARSAEHQQRGLSGRKELSEGTGMLFPSETRQTQNVWMAGMAMPIDIAWIIDDQVVDVITLEPCLEKDHAACPVIQSPAPIDAFLEVAAGELAGTIGSVVSIRKE